MEYMGKDGNSYYIISEGMEEQRKFNSYGEDLGSCVLCDLVSLFEVVAISVVGAGSSCELYLDGRVTLVEGCSFISLVNSLRKKLPIEDGLIFRVDHKGCEVNHIIMVVNREKMSPSKIESIIFNGESRKWGIL